MLQRVPATKSASTPHEPAHRSSPTTLQSPITSLLPQSDFCYQNFRQFSWFGKFKGWSSPLSSGSRSWVWNVFNSPSFKDPKHTAPASSRKAHLNQTLQPRDMDANAIHQSVFAGNKPSTRRHDKCSQVFTFHARLVSPSLDWARCIELRIWEYEHRTLTQPHDQDCTYVFGTSILEIC